MGASSSRDLGVGLRGRDLNAPQCAFGPGRWPSLTSRDLDGSHAASRSRDLGVGLRGRDLNAPQCAFGPGRWPSFNPRALHRCVRACGGEGR